MIRSISLLLVVLLFGSSCLCAAEVNHPNILWITCEDMSPRLGCYGDTTIPTPHIDHLAEQGVRYTRAFGTYGVCAPNRHTIITGMYPTSTGAMAMRTMRRTSALNLITDPDLLAIPTYEATPAPEVRCFTEYLRAAGYYCTNNSKTDYQFRDPITAWDESSKDAHWKNRPNPEMPFFAVFNSTDTHESKIFTQTSPVVVDPEKVTLPPYYPDTPIVRRDLARHYDNIHKMDTWVGKLLQELEQSGLAENTIVFFFSDHGDGLPRMKRWVYDSGIQVPLIIRFPDGRGAGTINEQLVSFVDFAPTLLSLAGIELPSYLQGQAFLGPQAASPRKYIYAARDRMDPAPETIRGVRDDRYKYVRNYRTDLPYIGYIPYRDQQEIMQEIFRVRVAGQLSADQWQFTALTKPEEELYDTQTDPHEIHNLATDPRYAEKLVELSTAHEKWKQETQDLGHIPESELIKKLWPPDGKQPTTANPQVTLERFPGDKVRVTITCKTPGASIAYRLNQKDRWLLYVEPFDVTRDAEVFTKANRLGWKHSETVHFVQKQ
ncbi:MAG: sulfatase [Planctomycetaceae bacterium]|nr:sulfatase [Planctomycetaceae bacterium]